MIVTLKIGETTSIEPGDSANCVCICLDGLRHRGFVVERWDVGGGEFLGFGGAAYGA